MRNEGGVEAWTYPLYHSGSRREGERVKDQTNSSTLGQEALVCVWNLREKESKELFALKTMMIGNH